MSPQTAHEIILLLSTSFVILPILVGIALSVYTHTTRKLQKAEQDVENWKAKAEAAGVERDKWYVMYQSMRNTYHQKIRSKDKKGVESYD